MSKTHTLTKTVAARSFDPIDFIQTTVPSEKSRAQILSSMAWYIDVTLVNQLRTLFFDLFNGMQAAGTIDGYNEFLAAMSEREQRETNLVEQGFMETEGIRSARDLLMLRQVWHDAALINVRHETPTIEQLLLNEKVQLPSALTKEKLRMLADDDANGDKALADEMFAELVRRGELQAVDRYETSRARIPAILGMANFIGATDPHSHADFAALPLETRKRLLNGMKNALGQATQRLASDRSVNVLEFMATRKELKAATTLLDEVLASPLFNDGVSQSVIDNARQDKDLTKRGFERDASGKFVKADEIAA